MNNYILKGGKPVRESDIFKWARWFEGSDKARRVALTKIGEAKVSTVFLAIDHNFMGIGAPVLWETMVFGGPLSDEMERYTSLEDAMIGHERMVARVRRAQGIGDIE